MVHNLYTGKVKHKTKLHELLADPTDVYVVFLKVSCVKNAKKQKTKHTFIYLYIYLSKLPCSMLSNRI